MVPYDALDEEVLEGDAPDGAGEETAASGRDAPLSYHWRVPDGALERAGLARLAGMEAETFRAVVAAICADLVSTAIATPGR